MCVWYSISNIQYHVDLFFDISKIMNFVTFRLKNIMLNAFYVIYTSSNENLEQHKRVWFLPHMASASLITHTDAAEIAF